jgi:hypothetical protein
MRLKLKLVRLCLEIVLILKQDSCAVCVECTIGSKIVLDAPMEVLGEWVIWNLVSVRLETLLVSVQYRCTVCAECTIGSEIILDASDYTPW